MAIWFLRLALIYFVVGIALGLHMAASHDFTNMPVHAHVNLLGWVSSVLMWLIYRQLPAAANNLLAKLNFILYHAALPVLAVSLSVMLHGNAAAEPVVAAASIVLALGVLCFVINILKHAKA